MNYMYMYQMTSGQCQKKSGAHVHAPHSSFDIAPKSPTLLTLQTQGMSMQRNRDINSRYRDPEIMVVPQLPPSLAFDRSFMKSSIAVIVQVLAAIYNA